jgi:uncharacterized protein (DUF488 family)
MPDFKIHTIGHSNHSLEDFIKILHENSIDTLIDVRSSPYSKHVPHFNKKLLIEAMENASISYIFLGSKIGGKPRDPKYYLDGEVNYALLAKTLKFKEGLREIILLSQERNMVLMCSEENPYQCHRHHLIGHNLQKKGFKVIHIRKDGVNEKIDYQKTLF